MPGLNFTQEDVDQNRLWYQHEETAEIKGHDSFRFTLSDLEHRTAAHTFFIAIHTPHRGQRSRSLSLRPFVSPLHKATPRLTDANLTAASEHKVTLNHIYLMLISRNC